ncbi:MAG: hypothetical protein IPF98_00185 [Gemmatimonadetes bacterium]|nr:hypothetical protein [Gemmatimonadota bacterium]
MHLSAPLPSRPSRALGSAARMVALTCTVLALAACGGGEPSTADSAQAAGEGPVASAAMTAPHGGMLVELGNRVAHVEFVLDTTRGILTAYVLDATARHPLRLTQGRLDLTMFDLVEGNPEVVTVLAGKANPRTEETYDNTSVFIGFVPQLAGRGQFRASLQRVEIAGQVFTDVPVSYPATART